MNDIILFNDDLLTDFTSFNESKMWVDANRLFL